MQISDRLGVWSTKLESKTISILPQIDLTGIYKLLMFFRLLLFCVCGKSAQIRGFELFNVLNDNDGIELVSTGR